MLSFVVESTVFLGFTYGFYFFFLKRSRSFTFNRYYFLFALFFTVIIPFVEIELGSSLPLVGSLADAGYYTLVPVKGDETLVNTRSVLSLKSILLLAYFSGFGLMLIRFLLNLTRLVRKAKQGIPLKRKHGWIILTEEDVLPYSFFRKIYMNRHIYERGEEVEKLLLHEDAHCKQYHSADVLFAEFMKVILWFNPFVWLLAKAIRLNHEYLADNCVLDSQDTHAYQLLLVNMELANQSIYLASDFNYSLTKQRIAMMNTYNFRKNSTIGKYAVFPFFLLLAFVLTFCEAEQNSEVDPYQSMEFIANDWWRPILERHEITPQAYNNFEYVFEMGSTNSIDENNVVTLKDAFFLIRGDENVYRIIRSPLATHNLETGIISGVEGIMETFNLKNDNLEPSIVWEMGNFRYQLVNNRDDIKADYLVLSKSPKEGLKEWPVSFEARDSLVIKTD